MSLTISERFELLGGLVSYRELASGAVPWLVEELVATEPARARLRRWVAAGGMAGLSVYDGSAGSLIRADVERRLVYLGDEGIRAVVVAALERIAPPARDLVLDVAWILGVGRGMVGWVTVAPPAPGAAEGEPLRLIALAGDRPDDEIAGTAGHEVAHLWLCPSPESVPPVATRRLVRHTAIHLAAEWGQLDRVVRIFTDRAVTDEYQAAGLARTWGFSGSAANGHRCALAAQQHVFAEAAAVLANGTSQG